MKVKNRVKNIKLKAGIYLNFRMCYIIFEHITYTKLLYIK